MAVNDRIAVADTRSRPRSGHAAGGQTAAKPSGYRADIDGLRAVAVLLVLIFHTGVSPLRGGYVGVDVFFVISGYLITRHIWDDLARGTFTIRNFYERRVRRIFPAMIFMIAVALVLAPLVLFPGELFKSAMTAIAALSSFANIYLLIDSLNSGGYFAADAHSQPFIHTWSLGVEEQFYLFFPLLLAAFGGKRFAAARLAVVLVTLVSFVAGVWLTFYNRDIAYYFPLTRAWELLCGSLLTFVAFPRLPQILREVLAASALVLILASGYKFHSGMDFPGYLALVPTVAATLLIGIGGAGGSLSSRLLSTGPFVWVGKISYSLYLWHWPIIVYFGLTMGREPSFIEACGLIVASVLAAYLSWRFVETPFRTRKLGATNKALWLQAAVAYLVLCTASFGFLVYSTRLEANPSDSTRLADYTTYDDTPVYRRGTCFMIGSTNSLSDYDTGKCLKMALDRPNVLLMGDSHGAHLWHGLSTVLPNANVMQATSAGCKPTLTTRGDRSCIELMQMVFNQFLASNKPDLVILSGRWLNEDIDGVVKTVNFLKGKAGRVLVSGPIVEYQRPLARLLAQVAAGRDPALLVTGRADGQKETDAALQQAVEATGAAYASPYRLVCAQGDAACTTTIDNVPLQWDYGHLTAEGSVYVAQKMAQAGALSLAPGTP